MKKLFYGLSFAAAAIMAILFLSLGRGFSNTVFIIDVSFIKIIDFKTALLFMSVTALILAALVGLNEFNGKPSSRICGFAVSLFALLWGLYCMVTFLLFDPLFLTLSYGRSVASAFLMIIPQLLIALMLLGINALTIVKIIQLKGDIKFTLFAVAGILSVFTLAADAVLVWFLSNMLPGVVYTGIAALLLLLSLLYCLTGFLGTYTAKGAEYDTERNADLGENK